MAAKPPQPPMCGACDETIQAGCTGPCQISKSNSHEEAPHLPPLNPKSTAFPMSTEATIALFFLAIGALLGAVVGWQMTAERAARMMDEMRRRHERELEHHRRRFPWRIK